jgi:hypothetical protein
MSSFGVVPFTKVQHLLSECAPGSELVPKKHHIWVRYKGRQYLGLPKGGHGIGTVEHMVKYLEIDRDCAKQQIPALNLKQVDKALP